MGTTEKIALGLGAALALYLGWKHFSSPAQQVAPATAGGNAVSSMTASAARNTVYTSGGPLLSGILWKGPGTIATPTPLVDTYASPSLIQGLAMKSAAAVNQAVVSASNAPLPNAPSPNALHWNSTGIVSLGGLQPAGNIPRPARPAGVS